MITFGQLQYWDLMKFQAFFDAFKQELKAEHGRRGAKKLVETEAKVQPLKNFSAELIQA